MKPNSKTSTIFKQLILNIIVPVVFALVILALLNQYRAKTTTDQNNKIQNQLITDQIELSLVHQDYGLEAVESRIEANLFVQSHHLVNRIFKNTDSIEVVDLSIIRDSIDMYSREQDIYIINRNGEIVNTTFEKDKNFNLFTIGDQFQTYLENVFNGKEYVSEKFSVELKTGKLRKYTYHPTLDGKYLIQTGTYKLEADMWVNKTKETLKNISKKYKNIKKIDLFIDADTPFSLITTSSTEEDTDFIKDIFNTLDKNLSKTIETREDGRYIEKEYIPMKRQNTTLYKKALIEIIADRTDTYISQRNDILQNIAIFLFTILLVIFLIYQKTRVITSPIKKLLNNVNRITKGDLSGRAEVEGNNEITKLSEKFNYMVENLEDSYNNLEQKVIQRTSEIQLQKDEIEEQKKHITDSIDYAERIQYSFLATKEMLDENLGEHFVFFRPKDVVSGDFYWADKLANGSFAIVNADSTGHGVPGAIMSILNISSIEEAVKEGATAPNDIFNKARKFIIERLKKDGSQDGGKDGMDASIICFNADKSKMTYTAAQNPIWVIRAGEIIQIKAEKMPVGKHDNDHHPFIGGEFDLQKGDQVYTLTDGYQDQFGGPKGKKFMIKKMREYVLSISHLSMEEQYQKIDEVFINWKGDIEQVDDVCVIGVKI